jgi:hypothetical protein
MVVWAALHAAGRASADVAGGSTLVVAGIASFILAQIWAARRIPGQGKPDGQPPPPPGPFFKPPPPAESQGSQGRIAHTRSMSPVVGRSDSKLGYRSPMRSPMRQVLALPV